MGTREPPASAMRMARAAANPSITGIWQSMKIRSSSGSAAAASTPSWPFDAVVTWNPSMSSMARAISWFTALSSTTSARPREPDAGSARMRVLWPVSTGAAATRSTVHSGFTSTRLMPVGGVASASGGINATTSTGRGGGAQRADRELDLRGETGVDDDTHAADARTEILQRLDGGIGRVDADDM